VVGVWVGFDKPETIAANGYGSRYALPIWADFMRSASRIRRPHAFRVPSGMHEMELCAVSYRRPVEGCPTYVEYLKDGDEAPGRLCTLHKGNIKQMVRRAVEGFFSGLGKKLKGIFQR